MVRAACDSFTGKTASARPRSLLANESGQHTYASDAQFSEPRAESGAAEGSGLALPANIRCIHSRQLRGAPDCPIVRQTGFP